MTDEKLEIPDELKSANMPTLLTEESRVQFNCHQSISCFNACCKSADVTLAPYDILRLQRHLGMSSAEFLDQHTVPFEMDKDGVPGVKLRTDEKGACLLLDADKGCRVYADRPTVCRYYPLGLLNLRQKDTNQAQQCYSLTLESHCQGHHEDKVSSVAVYRHEQGVEEYDQWNREWYELILKKRSGGPGVGRPNKTSLQLFFMASYHFDMFRKFVMSDNFKASYELSPATYDELLTDDLVLIQFGYRFIRQALFAERTIKEKTGAWEKRVEERRAIWEARTQAEVELRETQVDAQMREETLGDKTSIE